MLFSLRCVNGALEKIHMLAREFIYNVDEVCFHGQLVPYAYKTHPKALRQIKFRLLFDLNTLNTVDFCVGGQDSFEKN